MKIMSSHSAGRFWPRYEAWLSHQTVSASGFIPNGGARIDVVSTGSDNRNAKMSLEGSWSMDVLVIRLKSDHVLVRNQRDRDVQLARIQDLYQALTHLCGDALRLNASSSGRAIQDTHDDRPFMSRKNSEPWEIADEACIRETIDFREPIDFRRFTKKVAL
jgi:hypothetical protein